MTNNIQYNYDPQLGEFLSRKGVEELTAQAINIIDWATKDCYKCKKKTLAGTPVLTK